MRVPGDAHSVFTLLCAVLHPRRMALPCNAKLDATALIMPSHQGSLVNRVGELVCAMVTTLSSVFILMNQRGQRVPTRFREGGWTHGCGGAGRLMDTPSCTPSTAWQRVAIVCPLEFFALDLVRNHTTHLDMSVSHRSDSVAFCVTDRTIISSETGSS